MEEEEEIKEIRWEAPSLARPAERNEIVFPRALMRIPPSPPYEISFVINVPCIHRFPPLLPDVRVQSVGIFYRSIFVSVSR